MVRHFVVALGLALGWWVPARASDPNVLWRIVHTECVPHQEQFHTPLPCTEVNIALGWAVLKDIVGKTQFLLIPTARVTGIEDKAVLAAGAPGYWEAAWGARLLVEAEAGRALPDDVLSLAVNSIHGRSQNQLHIHIDCISPEVRAAISAHAAEIGEKWGAFPVPLAGHAYRAMRVDTLDRPGADPFQLVAAALPDGGAMGEQGVAAVGDGFGLVLLATQADPASGNWGKRRSCRTIPARWRGGCRSCWGMGAWRRWGCFAVRVMQSARWGEARFGTAVGDGRDQRGG